MDPTGDSQPWQHRTQPHTTVQQHGFQSPPPPPPTQSPRKLTEPLQNQARVDNRAVTQQQTPTREREKAQSSSGRQQHLQASRFNDVRTEQRPPQNIVTPYVEIRPQDRVTPQAVDFEEPNKLAHARTHTHTHTHTHPRTHTHTHSLSLR